MKKLWQILFVAMFVLLLAACSSSEGNKTEQKETTTEQATFPMTVKDALGREVTIEKQPKKLVSLTPSNTEILFGLGLDEEIVGVNDNDDYPEQVNEKTRVGGMDFNIETIVSLQPDLVLAHESALRSAEAVDQLEAAGVTVFVVKNAETVADTYTTFETIGQLTGKTEEAKKLVEDVKAKVAEVQEKVKSYEARTAYIVVALSPDIDVAGQKTFMTDMLSLINVTNAVQEEGWVKYSPEDFVKSNPDSIIFNYEGLDEAAKQNPAFATMKAIQNNALTVVDGSVTGRQGPRIGLGLEQFAKAVYPEAFK